MKKSILLFVFVSLLFGNSVYSQFESADAKLNVGLNIIGTDYLDLYEGTISCIFYFGDGSNVTVGPKQNSGSYDYRFETSDQSSGWSTYQVYVGVPDPANPDYAWTILAGGDGSGCTVVISESYVYSVPK